MGDRFYFQQQQTRGKRKMAWDDDKKALAVEMYEGQEPTPETSMEIVVDVAEEFIPDEKVWSAKYHAPAIVDKEVEVESKYESKGYSVYILEKTENMREELQTGGFYAYALACELGKLTHLEQYGVNLKRI